MAHQHVTYVPTPLAGTVADTTYFLRNTGESKIRVAVRASQPTPGERDSFPVPIDGDFYPTADAGEHIYVWGVDGFSEVVYVESN